MAKMNKFCNLTDFKQFSNLNKASDNFKIISCPLVTLLVTYIRVAPICS